MTAPTVKVKPLVWEGDGHWSVGPEEGWMEEANTAFGWGYSIEFDRKGGFKADSTFEWSQDGFDTPQAAKAAAQADYEARILSAIDTTDLDAHIGAALVEAADAVREVCIAGYSALARHGEIPAAQITMLADMDRLQFINSIRPTAITALDRAKREARVEGMRAAFKMVGHPGTGLDISEQSIRALIEKEPQPTAPATDDSNP